MIENLHRAGSFPRLGIVRPSVRHTSPPHANGFGRASRLPLATTANPSGFSISFWFRQPEAGSPPSFENILSENGSWVILFIDDVTRALHFEVLEQSGYYGAGATNTATVTWNAADVDLTQWHHALAIFGRDQQYLSLYTDFYSSSGVTNNRLLSFNNRAAGQDFLVGGTPDSHLRVRDVSIWNTDMHDELAELGDLSHVIDPSDDRIVAFYRFRSGKLNDSAGNLHLVEA